MNRNPRHPLWLLCALVALAFGLAGCGGDEPSAVAAPPAPPPAPPPFQPQPVEVALGENGGTATLMTTEAGGFTYNGEAFTGGADAPVEGEGGRTYVLSLGEDGTWSAAFQPMEILVPLGTSEESASLMTTEAGGFTLGDADFADGGTARNSAGASYTLAVGEDGAWAATFVPMTQTVPLGTAGGSVDLTTNEQNTWMIGEEPLVGDGTDTYKNNMLTYALARGEDGMWAATFVPGKVAVDLGASGDSVTLMTTEAGGFTLDGEAFASGATRAAANGNTYTLTLDADGAWSAAFVPMPVPVKLGDGSSVTLMTTEAMGYTLDGADFASGGGVAGGPNPATGANNWYTLTQGEDGTWTAAFVPATQEVALGALGGSVTLSSTETGAWAVDDSAVESGYIQTAENGNEYTLTLGDDATWTAAFKPMSVAVELGDETVVTLMTTEAMGYTLGGEDFASGQTVKGGPNAATGGDNEYTLTLGEDGMWMAAFVPVTRTVRLGALGGSVTLSSTEAGGWAIGDSAFATGGTHAVANGNEYTLTLGEDGTWTAAFKPMGVAVRLGGSGESKTLWTTEDMGYTLDGQAVASGSSTTMNTAGETYVLTRGEDGAWSAAHRPATQRVALLGASVTLATNEAGRWTLGDRVLASGDTVDGAANAATGASNEYVLTLGADGTWTSEYRPATMTISGTGGLVASARENGTGYDVADASLPASGVGEIAVAGAMYRVAKDAGGLLAGTRFDADIEGSVMKIDARGTTPAAGLLADDRDTRDVNEKNTALEFHTADFPVGALLGSGTASAAGENIVAKARAEMVAIRARVAQLVALRSDGGVSLADFRTLIDRQWDAADDVALDVFGQINNADPDLASTTRQGDVVGEFDRLVDALSSLEAFQAATTANGPDKVEGFKNLSAAAAETAFNRVEWESTAHLGALGSTRFGAAVWDSRPNATAGLGNPERAQAFAWSTMEATRQSDDVVTRFGVGLYEGSTFAAAQDGTLYDGDIEIRVRFTGEKVVGLVTNIETVADDTRLSHSTSGYVDGIHLPRADLRSRATWSKTTAAGESAPGRVEFDAQAGSSPRLDLSAGSSFAGRLLGRGDQSGTEAIGTWKAVFGSTTLSGSFGAARGDDPRPAEAAVTGELAPIGKTGSVFARLERGPALLAAVAGPPATDARPMHAASTVLNTGNTKFKYTAPRPDSAAAAADTALKYVANPYQPQRADVLAAGDFELAQGNWVADARAAIETRLGQLRRVIALDGADASAADRQFANDQRQRIFGEIQDEIRKVFGPGRAAASGTPPITEIYTGVLTRAATPSTSTAWSAHTDYPVNAAGVAQDAGVLSEIEDVIEALGSADALADALAANGLFAPTKTASAPLFPAAAGGYPGASAIFGRARGKLLVAAESTSYTRLGAWRHQIAANAVDALSTQSIPRGDRGPELGAFAYSPLGPTAAYSSASQRDYPASAQAVVATYTGDTVAAQGDLFYRGEVEARVFWHATTVSDSQVTVEITDLEDAESGEVLQVGNRVLDANGNPRPGLKTVESLSWTVPITNTGEVRFGDANSRSVTVTVNRAGQDSPFRPAYSDQLRLTRVWTGSAQNDYRFGTATDYWVLQGDGEGAGTDTEDDFGELSLHGVVVGGATERAPNAAELAKFTADVAALKYPKYVIGGPQLRVADDSEPLTNSNIFMFADGSLLHYGEPDTAGGTNVLTAPQALAIGVTGGPAANTIKASAAPMAPLLSANDGQYLWTHTGYGKTTYPTSASGGEAPGVGAPAMSPDALFEAFITAGDYVNVPGTDANLASRIEGMFVGQNQDGPLGIIGTWELTGGIFGLEDERGIIRGAFGADIEP